MSDYVKVTVDSTLMGTVVSIEDFEGQYGPAYTLRVDTGGNQVLYTENKSRLDQAFRHVNLTKETVVGKMVRFWKRPMPDDPSKGYLNMDLLGEGDATAVATKSAAKPVVKQAVDEDEIRNRAATDLAWAWETAWAIMAERMVDADPLVLQAVQAAAVGLTIRLEHERRGR